jgi:signal transduction histidine kinase
MVTVRDEGKGPPAELLRYASGNLDVFGVGMRGIAERVRELGGQLRIRNAMPGMLVEVKLPYSKDEAASDHTALLRKAHKRAT